MNFSVWSTKTPGLRRLQKRQQSTLLGVWTSSKGLLGYISSRILKGWSLLFQTTTPKARPKPSQEHHRTQQKMINEARYSTIINQRTNIHIHTQGQRTKMKLCFFFKKKNVSLDVAIVAGFVFQNMFGV